ncbi:MAG: UPF0175 family protein [Chloroflexi bacterium]|nr:UPF0175 family protein [Chloroflexota bacterium]
MKTRRVGVPGELLDLLKGSRLGRKSATDQVRTALAIHLFLEGVISIGKAAELSGEPRVELEWQLVEMGVPTVRYDLADYEQDLQGLTEAERRRQARCDTARC